MKLLVMAFLHTLLSVAQLLSFVLFSHIHPLTNIHKHNLCFRCMVSLPCNITGEVITLYMLMFIIFVQVAKRSRF